MHRLNHPLREQVRSHGLRPEALAWQVFGVLKKPGLFDRPGFDVAAGYQDWLAGVSGVAAGAVAAGVELFAAGDDAAGLAAVFLA